MTLAETVDSIFSQSESQAKEHKRRNTEKEKIEKKRKEYYEAHMKKETERLGTDHYFLLKGGGLPFLGLADNFLQRIMRFKQFFSLHFVMKTIFLQPFFKNVTGFL